MTKNQIKTTALVIMLIIIMDFAQADYNALYVQNGPTSFPSKIDCYHKCELECLPLFITGAVYIGCVAACFHDKCKKKPMDVVYNCISRCALTKSTEINNDDHDPATNVVDSCFEECQNEK
ncbi:hypothetical protein GLYMA_09G055200v4 [Glycine max]|uniref:Knottin scorpion toxin-like domain-containing protein n=2 Tax=Glycine subgen. Soja TaxID=1462606 RepID=K7LBY6_SOYBN|nr:hypothetical protein JHK85_024665 [Glycine max]KAG5011920.1 hypothetical protein JHK86_024181 [Glycine max]KAH1041630.1 hypothetical protein GYH30_024133 [Glycine max]KAH1232067.1 hypothetical protein GmHk_09G024817 [Glycine max]KRH37269.1 hypothetical protein GLYMA_09G055200v4 [Glycine max]